MNDYQLDSITDISLSGQSKINLDATVSLAQPTRSTLSGTIIVMENQLN